MSEVLLPASLIQVESIKTKKKKNRTTKKNPGKATGGGERGDRINQRINESTILKKTKSILKISINVNPEPVLRWIQNSYDKIRTLNCIRRTKK